MDNHYIYAKVSEKSPLVLDNSVAHRTRKPITGPRSPRALEMSSSALGATRWSIHAW